MEDRRQSAMIEPNIMRRPAPNVARRACARMEGTAACSQTRTSCRAAPKSLPDNLDFRTRRTCSIARKLRVTAYRSPGSEEQPYAGRRRPKQCLTAHRPPGSEEQPYAGRRRPKQCLSVSHGRLPGLFCQASCAASCRSRCAHGERSWSCADVRF